MSQPQPAPAEAPITPTHEIGRPTPEDIPRLLDLWKEQYDYHHEMDPVFYVPFTDELRTRLETDLATILADEEPHILVARDADDVVGFITFSREHDDYYDAAITDYGVLKEVLVTETARSRGIGQDLVRAAETHFAAQGVTTVMVQCSSFNPRTLEVYQKAGYDPRQVLLYKSLANGGKY